MEKKEEQKIKREIAYEFAKRFKQEMNIKRRLIREELKISFHQPTCACGRCNIPIWFTYEEVIKVIEDLKNDKKLWVLSSD